MDRYEEALAKARAEYEKAREQGYTWLMGLLEGMFPDLRESEDERIRKAIIELLKEVGRDDTGISENAKCMIAYLEKQKESTWTEEDERLFDSTVWHLRNSVNNGDTEHSAGQLEDWFKSIRHYRNRTGVDKRISQEILDYFNEKKDYRLRWYNWVQYAGRENWWMPREEQMEALENVIKCELSAGLHTRAEILQSLFADLKKL